MTSGVLIVGSLGLSLYTKSRATGGTTVGTTHSSRDRWLGDPFLQEEPSPLGEVFGWIMAGIYMGGRIPQIWLNVINSPLVSITPLPCLNNILMIVERILKFFKFFVLFEFDITLGVILLHFLICCFFIILGVSDEERHGGGPKPVHVCFCSIG